MNSKKLNLNDQIQEMKDRNNDYVQANEVRANIPLKFEREDIIQGLIYSEILGKPKAKRKRR